MLDTLKASATPLKLKIYLTILQTKSLSYQEYEENFLNIVEEQTISS